MSDIQEEQKRLYKRAEENDIKILREEINRLNNIINKTKKYVLNCQEELLPDSPLWINDLLSILQNKEK